MANFWDLPEHVREKIYRLHLVRQDRITAYEHDQQATYLPDIPERLGRSRQRMPNLLRVSNTAENEAAHIYYSENHFEFEYTYQVWRFTSETKPSHLRLVRKITCMWFGRWRYGMNRDDFVSIKRMKGLQELYIRVDEKKMIQQAAGRERYRSQSWMDLDPTPQQHVAIFKSTGMTGLLLLSGIPHVKFIMTKNYKNEDTGGPIAGGILETQIGPRLMSTSATAAPRSDSGSFPFLSLPPEVRNRIYEMVLCVSGQIHPSTKAPSSTPKQVRNRVVTQKTPDTALNLLLVNQQINDEAFGIFYNHNAFEFYYPIQFQAFAFSLGPERLSCLRDITIYYQNIKNGGVDIAELAFSTLKQLSGLRRLRIILHNELCKKIRRPYWFPGNQPPWNIDKANPLLIPGIEVLFSLRGVTDIKLRDLELENDFGKVKEDKQYPELDPKSRYAAVVKIVKALDHFNTALEAAQRGKVSTKLLTDLEWQTKDSFPALDDE